MSTFGVFFSGKTCLIGDSVFRQVDPTHFVLDVTSTLAGIPHTDLKELAIFLTRPNALPPDAALAMYVSVGGALWSFRGYISNSHPSDVLPLSWPEPSSDAPAQPGPGFAQIGISFEPLAEVTQKEGMKMAAKQDYAKRVGLDLFNFMQSFGGVQQVPNGYLLVPENVLDKWFVRLSNKLSRDPDFLTRQKDQI